MQNIYLRCAAMEKAELTAAGLAVERDSNPCTEVILKLISRCLGNHSDKIRRRILSNARIRIHSHTLTPHYRPEQYQMRRKTVEKQVAVLISISEKSSKIKRLRGQAEKQPTRFRII